jgi:quinol monooxygenase YgiN
MIGLVVEMKVQPGKGEAFEAVMRDLMAKVKANEPGITLYQLHKKRGEDNTYIMMEQYVDDDALKAHGKMPYMAEAMPALGGLLAAAPVMWTADQVN